MNQINIGEKIKIRREQLDYSLQDVADKMDVHRSTIMRWENGATSRIKLATIEKLAQILTTSPGYLMGYENGEEENTISRSSSGDDACFLPLIKKPCSGNAIFDNQNILSYELAEARYRYERSFYLLVSGDAMAPSLEDGDRVLVRQQSAIKDGQLGVFLLDDDKWVIRRYYHKNAIELHAFNPYYPAIKLPTEEEHKLKLIGVVQESKRLW